MSSIDEVPKRSRITIGFAITLLCLLGVLLAVSFRAFAEWSYLDSWKVHPDFKGPIPKKSDVIFSSRFKRNEAPEIARTFGATRIEWVHSVDPAFVESLRQVTPWFGGSLNSSIRLPEDAGIARDIEDKPIVAPWAKSWGAKWITTTDTRTKTVLRNLATKYLDLGASSIQIDEPLLQYQASAWGGDFSEATVAGFRRYLATYPDQSQLRSAGIVDPERFNYKEYLATAYGIATSREYQERYESLPITPYWLAFLMDSVKSYYSEFRSFINAKAGKVVPVSMNLSLLGPDEKRPQFELVPFADYAMVETKIDNPAVLELQAATYRSLGLGWTPSILPLSQRENRAAIATIYAMGGQPIVPWDVFVSQGPNQKPSRFFGSPAEYADLYQFVRKNSDHFDGHEQLAVVGIVIPVNAYQQKQTLSLIRRLAKARVPFALIPVGGTKMRYVFDKARAEHFRLLLSVNPPSEFFPDDMKNIRSLSIRYAHADEISDSELASLSPYVCLGCRNVSLYTRGSNKGMGLIVLHVIQEKGQAANNKIAGCNKTVGFRGEILNSQEIDRVNWHSFGRTHERNIKKGATDAEVEIDGCEEWVVLEFVLKNRKGGLKYVGE